MIVLLLSKYACSFAHIHIYRTTVNPSSPFYTSTNPNTLHFYTPRRPPIRTLYTHMYSTPYETAVLNRLRTIYCAANGQRTPTISHITQEQIRDIGGQVDLDCSVHYAQDYPVLWVKKDRLRTTDSLPLSTGTTLIIRDSRFSLRFDPASATYTLSLKDIQETDAGWYQCQVIMTVSNKITAEVELQVRRPPIISDNSTRSLVANEGESRSIPHRPAQFGFHSFAHEQKYLPCAGKQVCLTPRASPSRSRVYQLSFVYGRQTIILKGGKWRKHPDDFESGAVTLPPTRRLDPPLLLGAQMECYAGGFPPPKVSWRRENNAILPTGGSIYRGNILRIVAVHKEDRGTYYCVAENGVGKGARRNVNLEVEFAPVITVPRPRLGQALQFDMDLECHVEAYPPPAISWYKDEFLLSNNQHYRISHFATADEFTDTTIRVITIEKKQYGTFVCKAQNRLGTAEGKVELFETIIPVCPPACGQSRYSGSAAPASISPALLAALTALYVAHAVRRHRGIVSSKWAVVDKRPARIYAYVRSNRCTRICAYAHSCMRMRVSYVIAPRGHLSRPFQFPESAIADVNYPGLRPDPSLYSGAPRGRTPTKTHIHLAYLILLALR
ncbi:Lachesin [Eumeta japonica]|uniref:Lachesin n=1 Tax=Eumeta variegata TaxID=151549 RepID=A0A4C1X2P5_EUMVA|nr:Lachesin [Eumeta japonica]